MAVKPQTPKPPSKPSFRGAFTGPGSRKADSMASGLSSRIKTILDRYMDFLVRQKIIEVKGALRKNDPTARFERELANLLTIYGSRVLDGEMKRSLGPSWQGVKPSYFEQLFAEKTVLVQGLMSDIELEFQRNMGNLIGQWMTNEPGLTVTELSERIRTSAYLDGADVPGKKVPARAMLEPLKFGHPLTRKLWSRAALVARTEIGMARTAARYDAIEATGGEYVMWTAGPDYKNDRGHQDLDGTIIRVGDRFEFTEPARMGGKTFRPRYPKDWSNLPIRHIANCRCDIVAAPASEVLRLQREGKLK
jgi:hypothetical protein